ncbi:MAG: patatin-like phospholipase family protein [Oscillospiraceae bacterium]|nr:patatin-like phospholipase family protein [Oscillospiraceae bacterium]MCR5306510.1 patatin-like phospholipase family protein [Oscillospiraceae bacterium]
MESFGLALTGTGAKGAFQIGVLRYFEQNRMFSYLSAVSGAAVGAVNAVLFALRDFKRAQAVWNSAEMRALLTPSVGFAVTWLDGKPYGVFRADRVTDLLRRLPLHELCRSNTRVCFSAPAVQHHRETVLCVNAMPRTEEILEVLTAAATVPFPYPEAKLGDAALTEPEQTDQAAPPDPAAPMLPVFHAGCTKMIVVTADPAFSIDRSRFAAINSQIIQPGEWMLKAAAGQSRGLMPQQPKAGIKIPQQTNQTAVTRLINDGYVCAHRALSARQLSAY